MDKNSFELECPHCYKENTIRVAASQTCKHCDEPLVGEKYKKVILSAMTVLALGGGAGVIVDDYIGLYRNSVATEYKMVKKCIDRHGTRKSVRNNCFCAVESMTGILDSVKAKVIGEEKLLDMLDDRYYDCRD